MNDVFTSYFDTVTATKFSSTSRHQTNNDSGNILFICSYFPNGFCQTYVYFVLQKSFFTEEEFWTLLSNLTAIITPKNTKKKKTKPLLT